MKKKKLIGGCVKGRVSRSVANEIRLSAQMSMGEFKAWLDGFKECFAKGSPNKAQWKRIEERLNSVTVNQEVVYRDRPYWWPTWYTYTGLLGGDYKIGASTGDKLMGNSWTVSSGVNKFTISNDAPVGDGIEAIYTAATEIGKTEAIEFTT